MAFMLKTKAFDHNSTIPQTFTGEGKNISPALEWVDPPEGTIEFAMICDDPDAPMSEPFVHWVIYKIPFDVKELPEGVLKEKRVKIASSKILQGMNSFRKVGYSGPMPPKGHGRHRYFFKLYALSDALPDEPLLHKTELLELMNDKVLGVTELIGTYQRE